jgi:hypothetical protein
VAATTAAAMGTVEKQTARLALPRAPRKGSPPVNASIDVVKIIHIYVFTVWICLEITKNVYFLRTFSSVPKYLPAQLSFHTSSFEFIVVGTETNFAHKNKHIRISYYDVISV